MNAKKISLCGIMMLSLFANTSCGVFTDDVLTVYNWEDYIDVGIDENGYRLVDENGKEIKSVVEDFEDYYFNKIGRTIKVKYQSFSTVEIMYNQIKIGRIKADLICPSDYMIQKMAKENLLEKFEYDASNNEYSSLPNYNEFASPYIKELFKQNNFTDYAIPYMWGTMGFTYNPSYVEEDVINTWEAQWDSALKGKITIKDSVRDSYFTAVMHVYKDELDKYADKFSKGEITSEYYNEVLNEIFNRCDNETLTKCQNALNSLKNNIYGLEVDDGKNDIVTGKIYANLAWSGDSVYSMNQAEEAKTYLNYSIPKEGSNIWFDGWCMPKGAQVDIASMFVDYLSRPSVAARNMDYTGYTSAIAGQDIWDLVNEWYAADENSEDYSSFDTVDLSYFFASTLDEGVEPLITVEERGRQFDAQYPDANTIARCAIMRDFGTQTDAVYQMWTNFKASL